MSKPGTDICTHLSQCRITTFITGESGDANGEAGADDIKS
jgi:hypothetical protein